MTFLKAWLKFFEDGWFHIENELKVKPALPYKLLHIGESHGLGIWQVVRFSSTCDTRKYDIQKSTCKIYFSQNILELKKCSISACFNLF